MKIAVRAGGEVIKERNFSCAIIPGSNAPEKMRKIKSKLYRRIQMPKMRGRRQPNEDKRRGGTLGKITAKLARIKEKEGLTLIIEEFLEVLSSTEGHKGE